MAGLETNSPDIAERIRALRSEKRASISSAMKSVRAGYFGTDTDLELNDAIEDMFDDVVETLEAEAEADKNASHIGRVSEGYPLLLLGPSGTRKTSTVARMIHKRAEFAGFSHQPHLNTSPLISVETPSPCTLRLLGITIVRAMGLPVNDTIAENAVWDLILANVAPRGVRFVHIDEFQHVLENRNVVDIGKIRNAMKRLVQTPGHPVWLLISGMPEIATAIEGDTQLWRRKSYVLFRELKFERDASLCLEMIKFFAAGRAKLSYEEFKDDINIHRLLHASLFRMGIAIDIVVKAIRVALKSDSDALKVAHFARAYERFSGCPDESNPFSVPGDFTQLVVDKYVTQLLQSSQAEAANTARGPKATKDAKK